MTAGPRSRIGRLLGLPFRLFRMVRHHRHMEPVPLTYLMAAGVGLGLGVAIDLFIDVPWWLVAGGFVALVWLFFMSTAFWGPHRLRRRDVSRFINPGRARTRDVASLEKAIRSGELPAYAVTSWNGQTSLGGWGRGGSSGWHSITLRFTYPDNAYRWVEVETRSGDQPASLRKEMLAQNLLSRLDDPPSFNNIDEMRAWHVRHRREQEERAHDLAWRPGHLVVDGVEIAAEVITVDDGVAILAVRGDVFFEILARRVDTPTIELARVPSLAPYVADMPDHP
jgi:hypothetical protein